MTISEKEIFESTDSSRNNSPVFNNTVARGIYSAIRVLALDIFEDRYNAFFLPLSFNKKGKLALQRGLKKFKYEYLQKMDRNYLISIFNQYEIEMGREATLLLLDWIRNAEDSEAEGIEWLFFEAHLLISKEKKEPISPIPLRLQRYFAFRELLRDQYLKSIGEEDLSPDFFRTDFDIDFYKLQEYEYFGELETTFDPSLDAANFARVLCGKIAWENSCEGGRPDVAELNSISRWMSQHVPRRWIDGERNIENMSISPLLKTDYIRRRIIIQ